MMQKIWITGASSGIGKATAECLACSNVELILLARRESALAEVAETCRQKGAQVNIHILDITDRQGVQTLVQNLLQSYGTPDVLINNAGLARDLVPYEETQWESIDEVIDTNVKGLLYMIRAVLPTMKERGTGHIINMGSTAGQFAYAGAAIYCATKAAVKMLSDGIRIDTMATDIKVTTVMPGIVETPFSSVRYRGDEEKAAAVYEGIDALQAEDIAEIIAFILSRPNRVQISDITIMATQQATGFMMHRK